MNRGLAIRFLENFLCAGSSALLIPIAHLDPALWPISALALIPFLWRCTQVSLLESVSLAGVLAASYAFVTVPVASWATPGAFALKLLSLNLLFAVLGVTCNRLSKRIDVGFILLAISWLPLQYALGHYAHLGSILALSEIDPTLLIRIGSLSGALLISLAIVFINWLILIFLKRVVEALRPRVTFAPKDEKRLYATCKEIVLGKRWYYFPEPRAPPPASVVPAQSGFGYDGQALQEIQIISY